MTHGKGLTRLRRCDPPAPIAAAARGRRRGRHGAGGTCARKGQVPPASAPSFPHPTAQIPSLGSSSRHPGQHLLPGKSAPCRRPQGTRTHPVDSSPTQQEWSKVSRQLPVVNALGGAPPITAALWHGSASGRRHCAPTGGTERPPPAPHGKQTLALLGVPLRLGGLAPC